MWWGQSSWYENIRDIIFDNIASDRISYILIIHKPVIRSITQALTHWRYNYGISIGITLEPIKVISVFDPQIYQKVNWWVIHVPVTCRLMAYIKVYFVPDYIELSNLALSSVFKRELVNNDDGL